MIETNKETKENGKSGKVATILRKKLLSLKDISNGERWEILREYKNGDSLQTIADKYRLPCKSLEIFINEEYQQFLVAKETRALLFQGPEKKQAQQYRELKKPSFVSEEFMKKVEEGAWESYAFTFAISDDNKRALQEADLLCGLLKPRGKLSANYNNAVKLRGQYLRSLPHVREEIDRVKLALIKDKNIDVPYLQSELVQQLDQLKEIVHDVPSSRSQLIKCIELLGKSCGAWVDTVKVEQVDPSSALDHLIEMAKRNPTKGIENRGEYEQIPYSQDTE
jgi:hypothetical protein